MKTFLINILILIICTVAYSLWKEHSELNYLSTLIGGFVLANIYQWCLENKDYLSFVPMITRLKMQGRDLRISFASLIRIKVDDKYFLIKSRRFSNLWQPVGGVYKYFDSDLRRRFGLHDDNGKFQNSNSGELRLSFPKTRVFSALKLMKWFDSRLGREISPDREFREELIDTAILDKDLFKEVHFEFVERSFDLRFSDKFQVWELMAFEVFDLKLSDPQKKQIKDVVSGESDNAVVMTKREIDHDGFVGEGSDYRIGSQTKYVL